MAALKLSCLILAPLHLRLVASIETKLSPRTRREAENEDVRLKRGDASGLSTLVVSPSGSAAKLDTTEHGARFMRAERKGYDASPSSEIALRRRCQKFYAMTFEEIEALVPDLKSCLVNTYGHVVYKSITNLQSELSKQSVDECVAQSAGEADLVAIPPYYPKECNYPNYGRTCNHPDNHWRSGKLCDSEVWNAIEQLQQPNRPLHGKKVLIFDDAGALRNPGQMRSCAAEGYSLEGLTAQQAKCGDTYDLARDSMYSRPDFVWAKIGADRKHYRPGIDISLATPPLASASWQAAEEPLTQKPYFASFKGGFERGPIRQRAHNLFHNGKDIMIVDFDWTKGSGDSGNSHQEYHKLLHGSVFNLILRGDTLWSNRFNDVVCSGGVPVLVTKDWVPPLSELVPFDSYGVLIEESQLENMIDILRRISDADRERLRAASLHACREHFQTIDLQMRSVAQILAR